MEPVTAPSASDPAEALIRLFAAFNDRDWSAFEDVVERWFDPAFRLHLPKRGSRPLDRGAYLATSRAQTDLHPDLAYAVELVFGTGPIALTAVRHFSRQDRRIEIPICLIASVDGDRITTIEEFASAPRRRRD